MRIPGLNPSVKQEPEGQLFDYAKAERRKDKPGLVFYTADLQLNEAYTRDQFKWRLDDFFANLPDDAKIEADDAYSHRGGVIRATWDRRSEE